MRVSKREIKEIIVQEMTRFNKQLKEAPKEVHHSMAKNLEIHKSHIKKASTLLLKKFKPKAGRNQVDIDTKSNKHPGWIGVFVDKRIYDDVLELLAKNRIKVRG